ncbi:hypothetical protein H072_8882 [Dactylellina haptotyla CBS 200.50]|uniref:Uncharacterized protein n=1 Tax=Dactylellina haptotyla (strain CBS 200.50) TaxID=1284197 RepID=S8BQ94_DACHA|nr:hypothetical protein H072_8882 [Dactylellina haptotyla CBS 200.50]
MSHRRQHYDSQPGGGGGAHGRLPYDDERDDYHERGRAYGYENDRDRDSSRWGERRDGSYSPRSRDRSFHHDNAPRHESRDRTSPPYRRLERSRSPYYASNEQRPRRSDSRSPSPNSHYNRRSPPYGRDDRYSRRQYYDRDAPERYDGERGPYYGQPSRDIMLEGIGGDMADHDVATLLPFAI